MPESYGRGKTPSRLPALRPSEPRKRLRIEPPVRRLQSRYPEERFAPSPSPRTETETPPTPPQAAGKSRGLFRAPAGEIESNFPPPRHGPPRHLTPAKGIRRRPASLPR